MADLLNRVDSDKVNKRVFEHLAKAGAFDASGQDRAELLEDVEPLMKQANLRRQERDQGQTSFIDDLFSQTNGSDPQAEGTVSGYGRPNRNLKMAVLEKLKQEKELLGFYVSGHPLDDFGSLPDFMNKLEPDELLQMKHRTPFRFCGVVSSLTKRFTKADNRPWAFFTLSTRQHSFQINMFSKAYETHGTLLEENAIVGVQGFIANRDGNLRLNAQDVFSLGKRLPQLVQGITWFLKQDENLKDFLGKLRQKIDDAHGETRIKLAFLGPEGSALLADTAQSIKLHASRERILQLENHPAVQGVKMDLAPMPTDIMPKY